MRVCVTGGAGFIGSHLVDALLARGDEVVVLDDFSSGREANLPSGHAALRVVRGDLRDEGAVSDALSGVEVLFHLAAMASVARSLEHAHEVAEVNVGGTLNLLAACVAGGVRRFVLASSSSVYGDTPTLPKVESMPLAPVSPYAATKAGAEALVCSYVRSHGLEGVVLRLFNVYGPRQRADSAYAAAIPRFVEAMAAGTAPTIHGDGGQTRDFTYVGDVVRAIVAAGVAADLPPGPCNLGGGRQTSILAVARSIAQAVGYEGDLVHAPARAGDVRHSLADIRAIRAWLGWEPEVGLDEGLRRMTRP